MGHDSSINKKNKILTTYLGSNVTTGVNMPHVSITVVACNKVYPITAFAPMFLHDIMDLNNEKCLDYINKRSEEMLKSKCIQAIGRMLRGNTFEYKVVILEDDPSETLVSGIRSYIKEKLKIENLLINIDTKRKSAVVMGLDKIVYEFLLNGMVTTVETTYNSNGLEDLLGKVTKLLSEGVSKVEIKKKFSLYYKKRKQFMAYLVEKIPNF